MYAQQLEISTRPNEAQMRSGASGGIQCLDWSPNGQYIACGFTGKTSQVRVFDITTNTFSKVMNGHTSDVRCISLSPDGTQVVSGSSDETIKIWDFNSQTQLFSYKHNVPNNTTCFINCISWSPTGNKIVAGTIDGKIIILDSSKHAVTVVDNADIHGYNGEIYSICWSPDGTQFVYGCWKYHSLIIRKSDGSLVGTMAGHSADINTVSWENFIASGSGDGNIKIWDPSTRSCLQTFKAHDKSVLCIAWKPASVMDTLLSSSQDKSIKLWTVLQTTNKELLEERKYLTRQVNTLSWSPKGMAFVASFKEELKIRIYSNESVLNLKTISNQLQKTGEERNELSISKGYGSSGSTRTEMVLGKGPISDNIAAFLGGPRVSSRGGKTNKRRRRRTKRRTNRRTKKMRRKR